jgi:hypothetical protein
MQARVVGVEAAGAQPRSYDNYVICAKVGRTDDHGGEFSMEVLRRFFDDWSVTLRRRKLSRIAFLKSSARHGGENIPISGFSLKDTYFRCPVPVTISRAIGKNGTHNTS